MWLHTLSKEDLFLQLALLNCENSKNLSPAQSLIQQGLKEKSQQHE